MCLVLTVKKIPVAIVFLLLHHLSEAQKTEYGLAIGGMSYSGDLYRGYNLFHQNLGIQAMYRINFDKDLAFKAALLYGKVSGREDPSIDALARLRQAPAFSRSLIELSANLEYHFLDYKNDKSRVRWSPYVFAGLGIIKLFRLDNQRDKFNSWQPIVPFGLGFKHLVGRRFSVAIEYGVRKTFFDQLDRISDANELVKDLSQPSTLQYGNPGDQDWYHFINISFSYILYKIPCAHRYVPNKSLRR